jgi:CHASE2 domain-containing sensor protein
MTQPLFLEHTIRRVRRIQMITIVWMGVEAALSLWLAWRARSPALLASGGASSCFFVFSELLALACSRAAFVAASISFLASVSVLSEPQILIYV